MRRIVFGALVAQQEVEKKSQALGHDFVEKMDKVLYRTIAASLLVYFFRLRFTFAPRFEQAVALPDAAIERAAAMASFGG